MDISIATLAALALATAQPNRPADVRPAGPVIASSRFAAPTPAAEPSPLRRVPRDTTIEYSKLYYQRLTIHRWGSYVMLPLFAAQYIVGERLYKNGSGGGESDLHGALAGGVAGLFAVNTVTGLWNLYDGRRDPDERGRKVTHATLMLLADAGFVATGLLADESEGGATGGNNASTHRAVAIGSMALSTVGWLIMTDLFRKD